MKPTKKRLIYLENVVEITDDMGVNDLLKRLKELSTVLQEMNQIESDQLIAFEQYKLLACQLLSTYFSQHQSKEVRVVVACCIADAFRIFCPEQPYNNVDHLKTALVFLTRQLRGLQRSSDVLFARYFYLLENLACVRTMNLINNMDDNQEMLTELFKTFFSCIQSEQAEKVHGLMLDIMVPLLNEVDFISVKLMDVILLNIIEPQKTQNRPTYKLTADLIVKCEGALEASVQTFLNNALFIGQTSESDLCKHAYDVIYELYLIAPSILVSVLPQLELKLRSSEESERIASLKMLGRLFAEKSSYLAEKNPLLWNQFLNRFCDISSNVRLTLIQLAPDILVNCPDLREELGKQLINRTLDSDENIRFEAVLAISNSLKHDLSCLTEKLVIAVSDRMLDKKYKIRREASLCLGTCYRKISLNPSSTAEQKMIIDWIKNKILHIYYQNTLEDKLLCEKLTYACLVPYILPTEQRMEALHHMYCTLDENATKAFNEIMKQQRNIRALIQSILSGLNEENVQKNEKLLEKIKKLGELFPDSAKTTDQLKELFNLFRQDNRAYKVMLYIFGEDYTTAKIEDSVKEILQKINIHAKTSQLNNVARMLLERCAPVIIDEEAMKYLVRKVAQIFSGSNLNDDDEDNEKISERSFDLLLTLSYIFPNAYRNEEVLENLICFMRQGHILAGDVAVQILSNCCENLDEKLPRITNDVLPELMEMACGGTPKQAKHAVICITKLTESPKEIYQSIYDNLNEYVDLLNDRAESVLYAFGPMAQLQPLILKEEFQTLICNTVIPKIILNDDHPTSQPADADWLPSNYLSQIARTKIAAIRFVAKWLIGREDIGTAMVSKIITMLCFVIKTNGDTKESGKLNTADCSSIKVAAGKALLNMCQSKLSGTALSVVQFRTLAWFITDRSLQAREEFLKKLHKGLVTLRLPLEYMAILGLAALVKTKDGATQLFLRKVRGCIVSNINRRREFLRKNPAVQCRIYDYMPEYYLSYVVYLLSRWPNFKKHDDSEALQNLKGCLWFAMEPLISNVHGGEGHQFLYKMFQDIKQTKNAEDPADEEQNKKLWALCDLAIVLITTRAPNFALSDATHKSMLSSRYFSQQE